MTAGNLFFMVCSLLSVLGAVATVAARSPIRSAMGLLATIVGIAGLFLKLQAQFLSAIQLIVYAGAVVVLFIFVVMLLGPDAEVPEQIDRVRLPPIIAGGLLALLSGVSAYLLTSSETVVRFDAVPADHGSVEAVGSLLFTKALVPFELATALLIVAVVGAIAVARGTQGQGKHKREIRSPQDYYVGELGPVVQPQSPASASADRTEVSS